MGYRSPNSLRILAFALGCALAIGGAWAGQSPMGPFAIVEQIKGQRGAGNRLEFMDYVRVGQVIDLGRSGTLVLAHLDGCATETFRGGVVRVGVIGRATQDGRRPRSASRGGKIEVRVEVCQAPQVLPPADAREAGATVNRISPFDPTVWAETTIVSARPVFKWPVGSPPGAVTVRLFDMDRATPALTWRHTTRLGYVRYPANRPKLITGRPYKVEVRRAGGKRRSAVFSIDPGLEVTGLVARRVVALE